MKWEERRGERRWVTHSLLEAGTLLRCQGVCLSNDRDDVDLERREGTDNHGNWCIPMRYAAA